MLIKLNKLMYFGIGLVYFGLVFILVSMTVGTSLADNSTVDMGLLTSAIKEASVKVGSAVAGIEPGQYPQSAIDTFDTAVSTALGVANDSSATQAKVNKAVTDLKTAEAIFDAAKITTVNKAALTAALTEASSKIGSAVAGTEVSQYPQSAVNKFNIIISIAQAVANDVNATQAEVNQAVKDLGAAEAIFDAAKITTVDCTPPSSVTNLNENSAGSNWIRWTWINPTYIDFKHVMVYIDGAFVTNTSEESYNLTGLIEGTTHTISTKTVDTSVNINLTWVNDSAIATPLLPDTNPPASVTNLDETDSDSHWINWTWTNPGDVDFSHVRVYIDGAFVTSTSDKSINYYNATGLIDNDTYTISIQTVDTLGNVNTSLVNDSAIAVKLPKILSISGTNITTSSITLIWEASNDTSAVEISRGDLILENASGSTSYADSNLTSATTYNYTLTPSNSDGLVGKAVSVSLRTKSSSSSSGGGSSGSSSKSSSSGGGGGSASVESYTNLAMKDVDSEYLRMDSNVTYRFTKEGNPIQSVSLYSLKNVGETTCTIEVLNNRSKLVNSTPEGSIYKYINIWVGKAGFATESNIKDARVKFKVNNSWFQKSGLSPEDVRLQRYNGTAWEVLPTTMENNTADYVIYESRTPGFSPFAITAEKALKSSANGDADTKSTNVPVVTIKQTQPEKSSIWTFIGAIFVIEVFAIGYEYLRRRKK